MVGVGPSLERYRVISLLGRGGMSTVELADDTLLGRQVALKRVHRSDDVRHHSRLRREALVGASLTHPNLVSVFDIVTTESGEDVIVMEYVEGQTLRDALRDGKLDPARAVTILSGVSAALDAIHAQRIVHRDVKPGNILLGNTGSVKLADLGIAAVQDRTRITSDGAVLGTFSYMAPEQLEGTVATPAVDVYALAAVAYEALSGVKARQEPNPVALAHALSTQPPPDVRAVWPDAPPGVSELLIRSMSRDRRERPRSAGELTARLKAAVEPEPTVQVQEPKPARRPAPDRRSSAPAAPRHRPAEAAAAAAAVEAAAAAPAPASRQAPATTPASAEGPPSRRARFATPAAGEGPPSSPGGQRERVPRPVARRDRPSRRGVIVGTGLVLAAVVAAVIVLVSGSGSNQSSSSHSTSSAAGAKRSGAASSGTTGASNGSSATGVSGAGSPAAAVESFYHLAAAHQYSNAWALADPAFRDQLGGYASFQSGQAGDRSITFNSADVESQSSDAATVAISTTSVRSDGTKNCSGTVDLVKSGSAQWLLHQIHINCV